MLTAIAETVCTAGHDFTLPGSAGPLHCTTVEAPQARAVLVIVHGYGDHAGRYRELMEWMASCGVTCIAMDLRGHGRSAGRRGYVNRWSDYLTDLDDLLESPEIKQHSPLPLFLLGHSHGALAAASALVRNPQLAAGAVLTAPFFAIAFEPPLIKRLLARILSPILPWLPIPTGLRDEEMTGDPAMRHDSSIDPLIVRHATPRWYTGMLEAQKELLQHPSRFRTPLLMILPEHDLVSDSAVARRFYEECGAPARELLVAPGAHHELLREVNRTETYRLILDWVERRVRRCADDDAAQDDYDKGVVIPASE